MSQNTIENPLDRLQLLPDAMNWRGAWDNNSQYFRNDVVISSLNNSSYILVGRTALIGGGDPSLNPDWLELNVSTTGVTSINGSTYIGITGPGTNPTIVNNGVRTVSAGVGISLAGTANDPIVRNNGIVALLAGPGINVATPIAPPFIATIDNTGVRQINVNPVGLSQTDTTGIVGLTNTGILSCSSAPGSGITVSAGQNPTFTNTGILNITTTAGSGINITPGVGPGGAQNPVISNAGVITLTSAGTGPAPSSGILVGGTVNAKTLLNTGVRSITVGPTSGLSQSDTSGNITMANTGVLSVTAADTSIVVGNTAQNPTIRSVIPKISYIGQPITLCVVTPNPIPAALYTPGPPGVITPGIGLCPLVGTGPSIFTQYLANGTPSGEPNGGFIITFQGTLMLATGSPTYLVTTTAPICLRMLDNTTPGGPYVYSSWGGDAGPISPYYQTAQFGGATAPFPCSLGTFYFSIADARTRGLRVLDSIEVVNLLPYNLEFFTSNAITAEYYPLGLQ